MSKATPSWVQREANKIKAQQEKESIFFKIPEGETEIIINDALPPKVIEKDFKGTIRTRWQFEVNVEGEKKTLEVGKMLYRLIIKALLQGLNPMTIIRAGTDINTKYGIKGLMK